MSPGGEALMAERQRRHFSASDRVWEEGWVLGLLVVWLAGVSVFAMTSALSIFAPWHLEIEPYADGWHRLLALSAALPMTLVPSAAGLMLERSQVWIQRIAPTMAWRQTQRAVTLWVCIGVGAVLGSLLVLSAASPPRAGFQAHAAHTLAWVSGVLMAGWCLRAAWIGTLPGWWAVPALALIGWLVDGLADSGSWAAWQAGEGAPRVALWVLPILWTAWACAWVVLPSGALKSGPGRPTGATGGIMPGTWGLVAQDGSGGDPRGLGAALQLAGAWMRHHAHGIGPLAGTAGGVFGAFFYQAPKSLHDALEHGKASVYFPAWGSEIALHEAFWGTVAWLMIAMVFCAGGLHWRDVLAPGGVVRRRFGLRVMLTTWGLLTGLVLLMALAALVFLDLPDGRRWTEAWITLAGMVTVVVLQLGAVAAMAAVMAAGTWERAVGLAAVFVALILLGWAALWGLESAITGRSIGDPVPQRGAAWAVGQLLLISLLTEWARRAWKEADLTRVWLSQRARE